MYTSNALDPQSPLARAIYDLGIVSGVVFALIFVIVTGAIIYAVFRFQARAGEPDPKQIAGNRKVEICFGSGSPARDRKSTRLNSSHQIISYAVFCLKKKTCQ